jgi:hypothetical protein
MEIVPQPSEFEEKAFEASLYGHLEVGMANVWARGHQHNGLLIRLLDSAQGPGKN